MLPAIVTAWSRCSSTGAGLPACRAALRPGGGADRGRLPQRRSCPAPGRAQPGLHFHDLRHTGNALAARTGASTRDLMARMGHDSSQAALIYQHATSEADRAIAAALDAAVKAERKKLKKSAGKGKSKDKAGKRRKECWEG